MTRLAHRLAVLGLAAAAGAAALAVSLAAGAKPVTYTPPVETATLAAGPNLELAQAKCAGCHSVDYITTQPRSFANPRALWTAEVTKMRKVYGAQLTDDEAARIVDYLVATYGT